MICLGYNDDDKKRIIEQYCMKNNIEKVVILSTKKYEMHYKDAENIEWNDIIMYKTFYRLLQEIDKKTLIIINECLRTQNRHDLTYNCIRHYLNQTPHQLIFQYLPIIDTIEDFMILFDFDTRSQWKREKFDIDLLEHTKIMMNKIDIEFNPVYIESSDKLKADYDKEKKKLFDNIGIKDPHTIPRNLYQLSGKTKLKYVKNDRNYVGRNNRFKLSNMETYKDGTYDKECDVFEYPHNFIEFNDFLTISKQLKMDVLIVDLKVEHWYFERYSQWLGRLKDGYANLSKG